MDYEAVFPAVMRNGGFDAVVGNPPYVMLQNLEERYSFEYTLKKYKTAKYKIDTYQLFIEAAINILKLKGILSFITPNTFLKNVHSEPLRKLFLETISLIEINLFSYSVFKGASVDTCVFIGKKEFVKENEIKISVYESPEIVLTENLILQNSFSKNDKFYFNVLVSKNDENLLDKINLNSHVLGDFFDAYFGIQTFDRNKYVSTEQINQDYKPVIDGGNIEPYFLKKPVEFVVFKPEAIKSGGNPKVYYQNRICVRQIGETPIATLVDSGIFTLNTIYNIFIKDHAEVSLLFLLGCINSSLNKFHWRKYNADQKGTFPKIKKDALLRVPVPKIEIKNKHDKTSYDQIVALVTQMLDSKKQLAAAKTDSDKNFLQNKCASLDRQIDKLVYELYGLTEEEIKIVERLL